MHPISALAFVGLVALARGLEVTNPVPGDIVVRSDSLVVTWTHTADDPSPIEIALVNNSTNFARSLANDVDVTLDSYNVSLTEGFDGDGYQIELIPDEPGNAKYAVISGKFAIVE